MTVGVEVTTGPLGQGFANAVGLAAAEVHLSARFNQPEHAVFDNYTYVVAGDGCMQEGITAEAASLAGHWGLEKLIAFYDDNGITIDGPAHLAFTEDVGKRFEAYGFHVIRVSDGDNDLEGIDRAIAQAKAVKGKPKLIIIKTTIGIGSKVAGNAKAHGAPLGADEVGKVKTKLDFDPAQKFHVPPEVSEFYAKLAEKGVQSNKAYDAMLEKYRKDHSDLANELSERLNKVLTVDLQSLMPSFKGDLATRKCSEMVFEAVAPVVPALVGGSADLTESNLTTWKKDFADFQKDTPAGRYFRYGIREHAMFAVNSGMAAYGALIPFAATFLNFITYGFPAVRLAALSHFQSIYVMTHDSIGLGEDGPTHQPIEVLPLLRATPNLLVLRPADGKETASAYLSALANTTGPSVICLSRQKLPQLPGSSIDGAKQGAYVIHKESSALKVILLSTGSEVSLCVQAAEKDAGIRVVSMPCWELFEQQDDKYQEQVLPKDVPKVSVEAASTFGWARHAQYHLGVDQFGKSGPYDQVYEAFGLTPSNIYSFIQEKKLL